MTDQGLLKICYNCGNRQPLSEFYKRKDTADGRRRSCKTCHREVASARAENVSQKKCSACRVAKASSEFYPRVATADGLDRMCKECRTSQMRATANRYIADPDGMKQCARCKNVKPISLFANNKTSKDGHWIYCKECESARAKNVKYKINYGMLPGSYERILKAQGGGCAICHTEPEDNNILTVDHNHTTGAVRGILCGTCNSMLGMAKESHIILANAAKYLEIARNWHYDANGMAVSPHSGDKHGL